MYSFVQARVMLHKQASAPAGLWPILFPEAQYWPQGDFETHNYIVYIFNTHVLKVYIINYLHTMLQHHRMCNDSKSEFRNVHAPV